MPGPGPRPAARARWQQIGKPRLVITEIFLEVVVVVVAPAAVVGVAGLFSLTHQGQELSVSVSVTCKTNLSQVLESG